MNMSRIYLYIATLGPFGYVTASGTVATIITVPFMFWVRSMLPGRFAYGVFVFLFLIMSLWVVHKALAQFKHVGDPSEIVLDEVVGCLITFWAVPLSVESIIVGLILFRFFDILKFGGVRYVERLADTWGVVMDDVAAAVISNIILRFIF